MRKQDYLVELIAALSPNEKRYFKLFGALQPGEKRYMKLFDALERQPKYLAAALAKELGCTTAQLADDKLYLTQSLLQSLRNYDQESTEFSVLRNCKENAQVLMQRRLFNFALDIIEKAIERAWQLEAFELIDGLLIMRSSCYQNLRQHSNEDDMLQQHRRAAVCLEEVTVLMWLRSIARDAEIKGKGAYGFKEVLNHPLMKGSISKLHSLRAMSLRYEVLANYYNASVQEEALLKNSLKERALYEQRPEIKIINPIVYLTNLSRLAAGGSNYNFRLENTWKLKEEVARPELKISMQRRTSISFSTDMILIWNLRYLSRFQEAEAVVENAITACEGRSDYDRFTFAFEFALVKLLRGKPAEAADKIDMLLRFKNDVRANMHLFVRVMQLMAQLDLEHYLVVPSSIKAFKFWLQKSGGEIAELKLFFKHATAICKAPVNKRLAWKEMLKDIEANRFPVLDRLLHFSVWVKAKV